MDEITAFLKREKDAIKRNDYREFFISAYHELTTDQVKYLDQNIFPKALAHKSLEERKELSKKIMSGKLVAIDYILMRAVEEWKEDEGAETMSTGAFIESHIHNYLGMDRRFWQTTLRANEKEFGIDISPDSYGIEIISIEV
ncbi:MAG: hypothetical protein J6R47_05610 [Acholeplasmatales bacterium]|nr:hypothetical protein [Acholeplasmatales bacterium]